MNNQKNTKKGTTKNSKSGITLIALVVTIIVLLILAGISIAMLSGNNGILQRATESKTYSDTSQIQERINLAYHSSLINGQGKVTEPSLESELKKEFNKTTLDEGWLDKTSISGKWKITIDGVSLEVPTGIDNMAYSPLDVLIGRKKKNIMFNSSISIDDTTNAKFYDSDFNTCDDYIEYDGKIYKVSYNIDYSTITWNKVDLTGMTPAQCLNTYGAFDDDCEFPFNNFVVSSIVLTDIEAVSLGIVDGEFKIKTVVHNIKNIQDTTEINQIEYFLFDSTVGDRTCALAYDLNGVLMDYPFAGGDTSYVGEYGWYVKYTR